jgi:hypothetical protein
LRSLYHPLVQHCSAHANSAGAGKACFRASPAVHEADSTKNLSIAGTNRHAQFRQDFQGIRHQSFAARFIYRRLCTVRDRYLKPFFARGNGRCQPGRSSADDQHICAHVHEISLD